MSAHRSSGDLAADRRFLWAEASLKDGDAAAAADLYRQALDVVPEWPPAWFGLGRALAALGDAAAGDAFRRCLDLAPEDVLGATVHLARLESRADEMSPAYVAGLFDEYAERFDAHLTGALAYRGPEVIAAALRRFCAERDRPFAFDHALDLGCGTGLMAEALKEHVRALDGVDLSAGMLAVAARRNLYRTLSEGDIVGHLAGRDDAVRYDLVVAADVLVYLGDLLPLFTATQSRLNKAGLLAFTVQAQDAAGFSLGADMRFAHSAQYIQETAAAASLTVGLLEPATTRQDAGRAVPGYMIILSG